MKQLYVEQKEGKMACAVLENGALLSYQEEGTSIQQEQIYLAKADRAMKGMEAIFIRLTKDQNGFLPYNECREKPLSGQNVLVQVKKSPIGDKLPYCTCDISIAGHYVILTPFSCRIAVSSRIQDAEKINSLRTIGKAIAPEGMGLILRTESAEAEKEALAKEAATLLQKWHAIWEKANAASAPCLIEEKEPLLSTILRDEKGGFEKIITNLPSLPAPASCPVQYAENPFALENVQRKLEKSLNRKVYLPCGGYLVIDPTEAMTVIDVNSGKFTGKKGGTESSFLALNLEAAKEIARLVRLRNTGGIIIIDFVDMETAESRNAVLSALQDALLSDPVKCVIHGFTSLGLLEMTRKKTGPALHSVSPCPHCRGTGLKEEPV